MICEIVCGGIFHEGFSALQLQNANDDEID